MGTHTAPRAAIPLQITPEKADEGLDPQFIEQIQQQLAEGAQKAQDIFSSPHNVTQDESMIGQAPPSSRAKKEYQQKEYEKKVKELQALEHQIQQLRDSNLEFK